jgi:hypothetical protein
VIFNCGVAVVDIGNSMQYYSSKIHLHRPRASFGSRLSEMSVQRDVSRQICIDNAKNIASALQDYRDIYGDACTMSGVGLHIISTSATILIAGIVENRSSDLIPALQSCVSTLRELERSYIVARRVRRIIRLIVGLCHIEIEAFPSPRAYTTKVPMNLFSGGLDINDDSTAFQFSNDDSDITTVLGYGSLWMDDFQAMARYPQFDPVYN